MNDTPVYISVTAHAVIMLLLWFGIYRKVRFKRWALNKSVWIAGIMVLLYMFAIIYIASEFGADWFDQIFFAPCYILFFFLIYILLANLAYTIILLVRRWRRATSKQ